MVVVRLKEEKGQSNTTQTQTYAYIYAINNNK